MLLLPLALLAGCAIGLAPGPRQDLSAPERGRAIAAERCAGCHDVNRNGFSRFWRAPRFRDIEGSSGAIRAFAADVARHRPGGMPQILLSAGEASDLYAYIRSLQDPDPDPDRRPRQVLP